MRIYLTLCLALLGLSLLLLTPVAQAGLGTVPHPAGTVQKSLIPGIQSVVNSFLALTAVVALVFILVGGFRYMTAQGEEDQIRQAKNTILYAAIGILVIGLAAATVNFVILSLR